MLSVALGPALGFDTKDHCDELQCLGATLELGTTIGDRASLRLESAIITDLDERVHHVETLAVRYAATPRTWAELGAGIGSKRTSWDGDMEDGLDPAATVALGYAPAVYDWGTVDVQARFASTLTDLEHTSFAQLLVGMSWD